MKCYSISLSPTNIMIVRPPLNANLKLCAQVLVRDDQTRIEINNFSLYFSHWCHWFVRLLCFFWHHSTLNPLQHWGLIWKASLKFVINKTNHTWVEWHIPKSGAHLMRNKTEHESIILMRQKLWRKTFNFRNISPFLVELYSFCLETKSNYHTLMWKYLDGYQRFQHK